MLKTKEYNNLSEEYLKGSRRLKKDESVVLRSLNASSKKNGKTTYNNSVRIPNVDTVYDPNLDDFVQIAAIRSVQNGAPRFFSIFFEGSRGGNLILSGNSNSDRLVFDFLWNSNFNKNNENRDTAIQPLFEYVDPEKNAAIGYNLFEEKAKAMQAVILMKDSDAIDFAISRGQNTDITGMRAKEFLGKLAESDPVGFLQMSRSTDKTIKANISKAVERGIIRFDKRQHQYFWVGTGSPITRIERGVDHIDGMVNFILTKKQGAEVYTEIEEQVSRNTVAAKTPQKLKK